MSFFRVDQNNDFQEAPNFVRAPDYDLFAEEKDTYTYPTQGGWYWFDTAEEARAFFNITDPTLEEVIPPA
jgi:hypothetical protein